MFGKTSVPSADVDRAIRILNEALVHEPEAIRKLFTIRAELRTNKLHHHPTIQVTRDDLSVLGLINGIFGVDEDHWGHITAVWDTNGELVRFERTKAAKD